MNKDMTWECSHLPSTVKKIIIRTSKYIQFVWLISERAIVIMTLN